MKHCIIFITVITLLAASSGCGRMFEPTYPREKIPDAIKKLCKDEYKLTEQIDVKIAGKTLCVRIHLDELVDMNLKLQEKALDKIQDVLKVIRRICLSTDTALDFFIIVGYESKLGIEVVIYSYVDDLKKVIAGWMSPDDYFSRLIKNMRLSTLRWGENRLSKLIRDIESGNMIQVIVNNFAPGTKLTDLCPEFIKILTDLNKKTGIKWYRINMYSVAVGGQERLYYFEAKEQFNTSSEEAGKIQYPSGTIHKLYFLVEIDDLNPFIKSVYTIDTLPDKFKFLGTSQDWNADDFYVEDLTFKDFIATQITQRIQAEILEERKGKKKESEKKDDKSEIDLPESQFSIKTEFDVEGNINRKIKISDPSSNTIKIIFTPKKSNKLDVKQEVIDLCLRTIKAVCEKYKFYDIGKIQLIDNKGEQILVITKAQLFSNKKDPKINTD